MMEIAQIMLLETRHETLFKTNVHNLGTFDMFEKYGLVLNTYISST